MGWMLQHTYKPPTSFSPSKDSDSSPFAFRLSKLERNSQAWGWGFLLFL